mmetsp:Transcript_19280/g.33362  ORF Transcript_19280/g.33362 Transcript_19280/m.33362 type:complete len:227 (-) Transcript_19280:1745-2425(-)
MPTFKAPINTHPHIFALGDTCWVVMLSLLPFDSRILPLIPGSRSRWNKNIKRLPFSLCVRSVVTADSSSARSAACTLTRSISTRCDTLPVDAVCALLRKKDMLLRHLRSLLWFSSSVLKWPCSSKPHTASNSVRSSGVNISRYLPIFSTKLRKSACARILLFCSIAACSSVPALWPNKLVKRPRAMLVVRMFVRWRRYTGGLGASDGTMLVTGSTGSLDLNQFKGK